MDFLQEHIEGIAASALADFVAEPPWIVTARAAEIVATLLGALEDGYHRHENVALHRSATVEPGAVVKGPAIIGPRCFIAAGAYLRGGTWLAADCTIGPGAELKSSFLFAGAKLAHFNFVGDSILGHRVNLEAGAIIANYRNERPDGAIVMQHRGRLIETGVTKFGALVGDDCAIGANAVIAPGAILAPRTIVERLALVDQR